MMRNIFSRKHASQNDWLSRLAIEIMDMCNRGEDLVDALEDTRKGTAVRNAARRQAERENTRAREEGRLAPHTQRRDEGAYRPARSQRFDGTERRRVHFE